MTNAEVDQMSRHVGGAVYGADKVALVSSWLTVVALAGCMAIVAVVVKKRQD